MIKVRSRIDDPEIVIGMTSGKNHIHTWGGRGRGQKMFLLIIM